MYQLNDLLIHFQNNIPALNKWFAQYKNETLPIYSSIDIRDSGYKCCVVDTNLFPSGFNNIEKEMHKRCSSLFNNAIKKRYKKSETICLVIENHTRNSFYLEHVFTLYSILKLARFKVFIATLNSDINQNGLDCIIDQDKHFKIFDLSYVLKAFNIDLIFLNHDLSSGIPKLIQDCTIPFIPSYYLGWHSRLKSHHFYYLDQCIKTFSEAFNFDDWLLQPLFSPVPNVDIHNEDHCNLLYQEAKQLFSKIQYKYDKYAIKEKPFIFIKNDAGTYGMGVHAIESPEIFKKLNRKIRIKLSAGKYQKSINKYILQEGISTKLIQNNLVSEVCYYQIETNFAGSFFRSNSLKSSRDNLNSRGMNFSSISSPHSSTYSSGLDIDINMIQNHNPSYLLYSILARLACIAACEEQKKLMHQLVNESFYA